MCHNVIIFLRRHNLFAICNNTFSKWWESVDIIFKYKEENTGSLFIRKTLEVIKILRFTIHVYWSFWWSKFRDCLCWEVVQWLKLVLSNGPNRVRVSLHSPGEGNRCSFQNVVSSSYLEFLIMETVHKFNDSEINLCLDLKFPVQDIW
jgi:hypothetical protein